MKNILSLNLKREIFDQIASGEKTIEYREQKPYWKSRLEEKTFDLIRLRNGYRADASELKVEFRGMRKVQKGGVLCYAISLGRVRKIKGWNASPTTNGASKT